jgi:hypothetical protein
LYGRTKENFMGRKPFQGDWRGFCVGDKDRLERFEISVSVVVWQLEKITELWQYIASASYIFQDTLTVLADNGDFFKY